MHETFHMSIEDVFLLREGYTVFAGPIEEGEMAIIEPGPATILVNGRKLATVQIDREAIPLRAVPCKKRAIRALSTRDASGLTRAMVETNECKLEGSMRYQGHRELPVVDSPPADYLADDMTLASRLPQGWDGDAWLAPDGRGCFLRAWNKPEDRYAIAQGGTYEDARKKLLEEIAKGGTQVEIRKIGSNGSGRS